MDITDILTMINNKVTISANTLVPTNLPDASNSQIVGTLI